MIPPLFGLVLSGGQSKRMGRDKGSIVYHDVDQRSHCAQLLKPFCEDVFISIREEQNQLVSSLKMLIDLPLIDGPAAGLLAAHFMNSEAAWLVLACDLPNVTQSEMKILVENRDPNFAATCFKLEKIEPFSAIWEPSALGALKNRADFSPRRTLENLHCKKIYGDPLVLRNVNEPENVNK